MAKQKNQKKVFRQANVGGNFNKHPTNIEHIQKNTSGRPNGQRTHRTNSGREEICFDISYRKTPTIYL